MTDKQLAVLLEHIAGRLTAGIAEAQAAMPEDAPRLKQRVHNGKFVDYVAGVGWETVDSADFVAFHPLLELRAELEAQIADLRTNQPAEKVQQQG